MSEEPLVICKICQKKMHRVPQITAVNWGGLPPHEASRRPPHMQKWIDDAPNRRAEYLETKGKK